MKTGTRARVGRPTGEAQGVAETTDNSAEECMTMTTKIKLQKKPRVLLSIDVVRTDGGTQPGAGSSRPRSWSTSRRWRPAPSFRRSPSSTTASATGLPTGFTGSKQPGGPGGNTSGRHPGGACRRRDPLRRGGELHPWAAADECRQAPRGDHPPGGRGMVAVEQPENRPAVCRQRGAVRSLCDGCAVRMAYQGRRLRANGGPTRRSTAPRRR